MAYYGVFGRESGPRYPGWVLFESWSRYRREGRKYCHLEDQVWRTPVEMAMYVTVTLLYEPVSWTPAWYTVLRKRRLVALNTVGTCCQRS